MVAQQAHYLKVVGSNPASANCGAITNKAYRWTRSAGWLGAASIPPRNGRDGTQAGPTNGNGLTA